MDIGTPEDHIHHLEDDVTRSAAARGASRFSIGGRSPSFSGSTVFEKLIGGVRTRDLESSSSR